MYPDLIIFNHPPDGYLTFDVNFTAYPFDALVWKWAKVTDEVRRLVVDCLGGMVVNSYGLVPSQDPPYALILWYVSNIIYLS